MMGRLAVVINNKARNASSFKEYLSALESHKLAFTVFACEPEELNETINQCMQTHSILLIGGGDGTIRSAAQACAKANTLLGVLPLGTMNHFVKELELPQDPTALAQAIKNNRTTTIDLAEVNQHIFVNNASIGIYPLFAKKRDYYSQFYNKWLSYIPGLVESLRAHRSFHLKINQPSHPLAVKTCFLMVSNNLYSYEFPFQLKREDFHSHQLGLYFYKHRKLNPFTMLYAFLAGKKNFEIIKSTAPITVNVDEVDTINVSLDGEPIALTPPLIFKSHPQILKVFKNNL